MEIVHIKLPYKRGEIRMFEILGQNLYAEGVWILYDEAFKPRLLP